MGVSMQRLKVLALLLAVALMLPACATFQSAGDSLKAGGKAFAESFDVDAKVGKSGASVTVEGAGVAVSVGGDVSKGGASLSVSGDVDWKAVGCVLTGGLFELLCAEPEPELAPQE